MKEQLKLIIQDAYLYDYGIRKIGYDSEFGYDEEGKTTKELYRDLGIELTDEEVKEYNTFIISEFPFFLRVPPKRFFIDPDVDGPGFETAKWVAEEFYRPLADVLDDDRYKVPSDLPASHILDPLTGTTVVSPARYQQTEPQQGDHDVERVRLFEIWDKKERKVFILADTYDGIVREQDDVWDLPNFFPYDRLTFNPISDEHYSTSDAMYIERQQLEINDERTQLQKHRVRENLKILVKRGAMREEELQKLQSGDPLVIAQVDAKEGDIRAAIMVPSFTMSQDIWRAGDVARSDIKDILAMGQNQMGQELGRRKTAAEAMIINQYAQLRGDERRDIMSDFIERSVADINRLIFKFWDATDVIKVVGPEGVEWVQWSGEQLAGEYAVRLVPNSTLPMTKEMYQKKTTELLQKYANDPYIDQRELRRIDLDAYEEFDTNALLLPHPDPMQVMVDFRPGQERRSDPQSRINIPEQPGVQAASQEATEMGGGGSNAPQGGTEGEM